MFHLPNIPTIDASHPGQASIVELADLWEILALQSSRGTASLEEVKSILQLASDPNPQTDSEDDIELEALLENVLSEINDRAKSCGLDAPTYPFSSGVYPRREVTCALNNDDSEIIYVFLLLTTRFNMQRHRVQNKLDGALLFEELCEVVLGNLLGVRRKTLRFGASTAGGSFQARIANLCKEIGEGVKPRMGISHQQDAGDDGLDIAAWMPFSDDRGGKKVLFAQCKTGSTWDIADMTRLKPDVFCRLWMFPTLLVHPLRAFMSSLRMEPQNWEKTAYADLFMDRCRIMDYAENIPGGLIKRLRKWVVAAKRFYAFKLT
jgi:hypothetical protein